MQDVAPRARRPEAAGRHRQPASAAVELDRQHCAHATHHLGGAAPQLSADRETMDTLARLYADTRSTAVQAAVAGALIRAELRALYADALARTFETRRRGSAESDAVIDALLRRLQRPGAGGGTEAGRAGLHRPVGRTLHGGPTSNGSHQPAATTRHRA